MDGEPGSGKTPLSSELAKLIGGSHIEVDNHLDTPSNGRTYLQQVKFSELKEVIEKSKAPIFLDCFIAMDVLKKMNLKSDLLLHWPKEKDSKFIICCDEQRIKSRI